MSIKDFDKKFGDKGITQRLNDIKETSIILDSGLFGFNVAHGIGGIKTGAVVRIMGGPGLGKSSISYRIAADGLRHGMSALVIDTEGGLNPAIFKDTLLDYGLDPDGDLPLRFISPVGNKKAWQDKDYPTIERLVSITEQWADDKDISPKGAVVIFDSVDGLAADAMIGSKVDDATVALISRRLKNWLRMYHFKIVQSNSLFVFVHQRSANIAPMARENEAFTGGNALDHWSKLNLRLKDIGQEKEGDEQVGRKVKGIITKSKMGGLPWRTFDYVIRYDVGPDDKLAVLQAAIKLGIIQKSGAWLNVPGFDKAVQRGDLRQYWMDNPNEFIAFKDMVLQSIALNPQAIIEEATADEKSEPLEIGEEE